MGSEGTNPCTRPSFATKNVFDVLQDLSESIGGSPGPQLDAADGQPEPIVHDLHESLVELLERPEILSLHAVRRVGRERQLHLKVRALCGEVEKVFDVLVDTGAQVSLVKAGLLPPECLTDSRKPVRLKVANGQYMVGGTKEAAIGLQFVNHRELSRPDLGKEILLHGRFYEAEMDWDMIVGYDFMMETDSSVLPAQASMTLYQDDQLSWLSSPEHHVECQWIHPERNQLEVAALDTEPTGPANQEYGVRPEVASRVVADLGASDLALDAFSSGTSAHLQVCEKYWSAQDSAWKKHWGPHQGLMWIHCPRWDIPRAIAKIRKDRSKAVLVVPMGCTEEESTRHWVASLTNMTLNKVVLPAGESVYQDAKGQPMPPQRWPTEFHYVDGGLDQADTTDFVCVNRIIAEPWRQCFTVPPVDIEESESEEPLTEEEWDLVQGYMDQPFHDWGNQREGKGQDKAWWEVDSIVSGSYDGDTFVRRVLDHLSSQDEPIGGNPPTYGDLFRGKTRDGPLGHLGTPPEPKASGVTTPQVSSVVQVPGKAKAESDDCPKIQALRAKLKQKYGDAFFSGKPVFPPPVRGPYGEAKIRLKQDPRVYRHREFALRGERKEAMEKILRDFIQRGWLEPCHSEWASPCFVVPKKVAGEWRLVVDYRGLNAQTQHDSYTLPLIEDMLQKQHRRRIFTVIDLKHGYHQMPLAEESRACTAMSTPLGLLQWHKEHVDTPSGPASRWARWHETLAKFDLTVVYIPGKDNTVADCLSRWAYPASKGMQDISAHGDEAETAEAKRIIEMERLMEEEGAKCFVVMAADAPLATRVSRAVRVLAPEGAESDKHLFPESCLQDDWTDDYAKSEAFAAEYRAVTDPDDGRKWPKGLTEEDGKLYRNGKLLVPESRVLELCEAWHHHMLHPGVKKQALDMQRRFEIDHIVLYTTIKKVRKGCSVCQACNPDNRNVKGEPQWTPVPDQPMESVAMDVFSMPEVHIGKETFDCVVLCVDRHSGYVVAVPARKKGLLAKEVAVMMIRHWLTVFDIPRTICSDRGPQFTGGWFKAMCSLMGIRHAKSVAYLSRSNGRAEVAGRQLFEKLRKIHITNPRRNWFEEMWPALKAHHDTPTPGGLSPHQILFGRDPLGRGLPLSGDGMAMDAKEFFARQEQTARDIRQQLEKEHAERQKSAPSSTAQKFRVGDPVWVIRPRPMGTHRTKTWFTPGEVVRRIGEDTYRIKVGHGQFRERHESQLRVREPDLCGQHVSLSYAAHEADSDDDYAEQDDYTVEKILAQRPKASAPGGLEFKVRWRGYGPSHDTWEPVSSFVPRVNTPFMEYIRKHKTKIHVLDLAALTRAIAARGA